MEILVKNVGFSYGRDEILRGVNLEFDSREFLAIIGPNGGGKSTLLKLILSLLTPTSGEILINSAPAVLARQNLGFVPQNIPFASNFPLTALEVVKMGLLKGVGGYDKSAQQTARDALSQVGLSGFENAQLGALSGGQRQRVFVARALASRAKILLLDEPTASIDPRGAIEIFELLKELNADGIGVIVVCHDVSLALNFASKVAFVNQTLVLHHTPAAAASKNSEFLNHLQHSHEHFCGVELTLGACECRLAKRGECSFLRQN